MKHTIALPLCLVILFAHLPFQKAAGREALPLGSVDFSHSSSALQISNLSPRQTSIRLDSPEVQVLDSVVDYRTYHLFAIPGEPFDYRDGAPTLPQMTRLYRIPNTGSVELNIDNVEFDVLEGIDPLPMQTDRHEFVTEPIRDAAVYDNDGWYPPELAVLGSPMIFRDFRVVQVTLYPVQVNPVTHQARIYRRLDVDLSANDQPGENELLNPRRPSGAFAPLYRSLIANLDESALDGATATPGTYMILCRNNPTALQWADTLARWKRRAGFTVAIDARTSWSASQMRSAIQTAYNNDDPPLEFACILGDARSGSLSLPTDGTQCDHYFACPGGTDNIEDIGIGRLPCSNGSALNTVVAKIMAYERDPYMTDPMWFHRAFLYCGTGSGISSNEITMIWADHQFRNFTGVDSVYRGTHSGAVSEQLVRNRLNQGVCYFLWRGSVIGEMDPGLANSCNNGSKLPVVLTITCGTGNFNSGTTSLSESWVLAGTATTLRGGVCGIGTQGNGTHVQYNNTVAGGLAYAICNLGIQHLGLALAGAKVQVLAAFPTDYYGVNFVYWNNLMGDPGLSLWTDAPTVMSVTHPGTINVGTRSVRPQVTNSVSGDPIADAVVVLWKDPETYVKALTDEGGFADLPVTVNSTGTLLLTVTKHNHKPYLADIPCVDAPMMVTVFRYSLDDDNTGGTSGNGDGQMNPGETIDLTAVLRNFGTLTTATSSTAVLTSSSAHVQVVQGTAHYPSLAPGDSSTGDVPFRIQISPQIRHREDAILTVTVTADAEVTHSTIRLAAVAGEAIFSSTQVVGGDGDAYLEPGETAGLRVTIRNTGGQALNNVSGVLHSSSGFVGVIDGDAMFGTIPAGQTANNSGQEFQLVADAQAFRGHPAGMLLVLTTGDSHVDSVTFVIRLGIPRGVDPTGPDAYGYYAYDQTDTACEMHRAFNYFPINVIGTNLNLNDPGEQPPNAPTYSTMRNLPFPFTFYGQSYNQITICANGWAAFGDQDDQDEFRNYPIPGQQAPDAMIAAFWDDLKTQGSGLGVWEYSQPDSHRYVIQWKAQGASDPNSQDFEIILLDPSHYPTRDGNGLVIVQYNQVSEMQGYYNDIPYATLGIQAPGGLVGLQYRFNNTAAPGAANLVAHTCIVYTTESRSAFGIVRGTVTDAANQAPLGGVEVVIEGREYRDTSDAAGQYEMRNVLIGSYAVRARKYGYNDNVAPGIAVIQDSTATVDFSMLHPEIVLSVDNIHVSYPQDPLETSFEMQNPGNGPLDYEITVSRGGTGQDNPWDYVTGYNLSAATGDQLIQGCELLGDYWYVSGAGNGQHNVLYRFDLNGNPAGSIPQPSDSSLGWMDMATDGHYLFGSNGSTILGINPDGQVQVSIPSPVNPARALAYDPQTDHFWVADFMSDVYEITRVGQVIRHFAATGMITGLAWNAPDASGYRLYIFERDETAQACRVYRMHPGSGDQQFLREISRESGDRSGGCTITGGWNSTLLVFAGVLQNNTGDHLGIWELEFNTTWITVTPMMGTVEGGTSRQMDLQLDPISLRPGEYTVQLNIANNAASGTVILPVTFSVASAVDPTAAALPAEYRLYQNYPNPFNSRTTVRYDLNKPGMTTLRIYNLLGQEVRTVVNEVQQAGTHTVNVDLNDLGSGVFIYHLRSGDFQDTRKLVLIR